VIEVWREKFGLTIHDGYGQTETIVLAANMPGVPVKPGSMGLPFPGHDVRVINNDLAETKTDELGELAVRVTPERPPSLFLEYWKNAEETASVFKGDWYLTGDQATRDADGYLWFVGRADDVIISAGYRIGPFEVESALLEHPAVMESAVVATPDADRGSIVKAFVKLRPRRRARRSARRGTAGALQAHHRAVQIPARDRIHRRAAQDSQRKDPPRRIAQTGRIAQGPPSLGRTFRDHSAAES